MTQATVLNDAINKLISQLPKGASISLYGKAPKSGYMVGGFTESLIISDWKNSDSTWRAIWKWAGDADRYEALDMGAYLGSWIDSETDKLYIDISDHIQGLTVAVRLAATRNEIAIWDVANAKEIRVKVEG